MPTITLNLDVTNAELTRLVPAVRTFLGLPASANTATVQTEFRNRVRAELVGIVRDYERQLAEVAAAAGVTEIAPT